MEAPPIGLRKWNQVVTREFHGIAWRVVPPECFLRGCLIPMEGVTAHCEILSTTLSDVARATTRTFLTSNIWEIFPVKRIPLEWGYYRIQVHCGLPLVCLLQTRPAQSTNRTGPPPSPSVILRTRTSKVRAVFLGRLRKDTPTHWYLG